MGAKHQFIEIELPEGYSQDERQAIAQDLIDYVVERSQSGKGKGGKEFAPYSDAYVNSLDFKIAGKSKNDVNMTLSGDMLADIKLLDMKRTKLVVGFENGTESNAKADGNIRGTYGQPKSIGPKRDFLGVTQKEVNKILENYPLNDRSRTRDRAERVSRAADLAEKIASKIKTGGSND